MPELSDLPILPSLATPASDDLIPIHDISERNGTRKITMAQLAEAVADNGADLNDMVPSTALTGANVVAVDDDLPIYDGGTVAKVISVTELAKALVLAGSATAPDADDFVLVLKADGSAIYKASITQILAAT